jgi:hypothetical protein
MANADHPESIHSSVFDQDTKFPDAESVTPLAALQLDEVAVASGHKSDRSPP